MKESHIVWEAVSVTAGLIITQTVSTIICGFHVFSVAGQFIISVCVVVFSVVPWFPHVKKPKQMAVRKKEATRTINCQEHLGNQSTASIRWQTHFPHVLTVSCALWTQALGKYHCVEKETDMLLSTLSAMQEKAQHLECNLSAETRIKLDLFSALGDTRRQLEIAQGSRPFLYSSLYNVRIFSLFCNKGICD